MWIRRDLDRPTAVAVAHAEGNSAGNRDHVTRIADASRIDAGENDRREETVAKNVHGK